MTSKRCHGFVFVCSVSSEEVSIVAESRLNRSETANMREIVHLQAGQCGNQIGAKVITNIPTVNVFFGDELRRCGC